MFVIAATVNSGVFNRQGQTYRDKDPQLFFTGYIFEKTFRRVQESQEVDSSFFITKKQE